MSIITFKEYKNAVRRHYEIVKTEVYSGVLTNPSPAQIRTLCFVICDKDLNRNDGETFKLFFETKEGELIKKSIDNCNIDKFRPIISFLKGETDTENRIRVEMAAIICGFNPRPYSQFSKNDFVEKERSDVFMEEKVAVETFAEGKSSTVRKNLKKKIGAGVLGLGVLFSAGYGIKESVFPKKECMIWVENHYEMIDCQDEKLGLLHEIVKPYQQAEFQLKKMEVCDTTSFFKNGKSIVFYSKKNGEVTFFNQDGVNPENGAQLKSITQYMINKYVSDCK
jgi:hypothetical protein